MNRRLEDCDGEHENWQAAAALFAPVKLSCGGTPKQVSKCQKVTHLRKFALFIHIDEWGPMVLGRTCRYCSRCAMVMVQRAELEMELAHGLSQIAPQVTAKHYLVLGTMEKKIWRDWLDREAKPLAGMLEHVADFKHQCELQYKPGG
jgi:hypothetical protein